MRMLLYIFILSVMIFRCEGQSSMKLNQLTPEEARVIKERGTEKPFTGEYLNNSKPGVYLCKQCNAPLYRSNDKFESHCGWPSFDDEIPGAVKRLPDPDGRRIEIRCSRCDAHLGHVFEGEEMTEKNVRHCVNSISLTFVPDDKSINTDTAIFASGCFWGTQHHFARVKGVVSTEAGFSGGITKNPTYEEVCTGKTMHAEAVRAVFNTGETSYEELAKLYFETHDPTQTDRQGPDIGTQYRSVIFYSNDEQKATAEKLINILKEKGYNVVTKLEKATDFWKAEEYHQDYYRKNGGFPYCHIYQKKF